jgi:hypothetical protein
MTRKVGFEGWHWCSRKWRTQHGSSFSRPPLLYVTFFLCHMFMIWETQVIFFYRSWSGLTKASWQKVGKLVLVARKVDNKRWGKTCGNLFCFFVLHPLVTMCNEMFQSHRDSHILSLKFFISRIPSNLRICVPTHKIHHFLCPFSYYILFYQFFSMLVMSICEGYKLLK